MLETSTDLLLIAIALSVVALTGYLCYLIYQLAKTVQEAKKTVEDVNKKLEKIDPVVDSSTRTIAGVMDTVDTLNNSIAKPLSSFSKVIRNVKGAVDAFKRDK